MESLLANLPVPTPGQIEDWVQRMMDPQAMDPQAMDPQAEPVRTQPVPTHRIHQLPLVEGEAGSSCPICLGETEQQQVKRLPCGHTYHSSCIDRWLQQNHTCPTCRASLLEETEEVQPEDPPVTTGEVTSHQVSRLLETRRRTTHSQIPPSDNSLQVLPIRVLNRLIRLRGLCDLLHSGMERSHLESLLQANPPSTSELVQIALDRYPRYTLRGLERNELVQLLY